MQVGYNIYSYFINLKDTSVKFIMPNTIHHLTIKSYISNIQLLCNQDSNWIIYWVLLPTLVLTLWVGLVNQLVNILENCICLWTRRESNPPRSPCKGVPPALEHASPKKTHLKDNKFKELCAIGGIEPIHIWPLLIYIVSSCIFSLEVKPTCTQQLQSPIYCDKPAFIWCFLCDPRPTV